MPDVSELYREVVLDHGARPRNCGRLAAATHSADGDNPLCGDSVHVELAVDHGTVTEARFEGTSCCVIATASASLMTEAVRGKTVTQVRAISERMRGAFSGQCEGVSTTGEPGEEVIAVFAGVRRYPLRAKCATLAWRTLLRALDGRPS